MDVRWFGSEPRRYHDPLDVVEAFDAADVAAALRRADDALAQGYSIAGYLAYEAGLAAAGLATGSSPGQPLLALGIFDGPQAVADDEPPSGIAGPLVAQISRERYRDDLASIARALFEGDAYQVNYTVPFAFRYDGDALALFASLRRRANVPYASFVRHRGRAIVSLSPELFFAIDGDLVTTKPMKGTSAPGAAGTLASEKNRAEHVMIVDLMRNDLGRICSKVDVPLLFEIENYPTFSTMTSTIEGRLENGRTLGDAMTALFPCGSITGAPKRAAMREIARLERASRSVAMGTIGYCDPPRRGCFSVAIRTAVIDERTQRGELRIGGGIVADSDASGEWAEILTKRRAFEPTERSGLFETMRASCDGELVREAAHLERLERSAFALGIAFDGATAHAALRAAARRERPRDALVRLTLDAAGGISTSERALEEASTDVRLCVAPQRLHANDPALRHKTTSRGHYDAALAYAREKGCFEAALLDESGVVADGARATIFLERDGALATPPLAHGALAGILRGELLAAGLAFEAAISPRELRDGRTFVGSSARGLIAVRSVDAAVT